MFKSAKWRSENNRITVVFKLQFHATQVSEFAGDGLVLSLVSAESGKPMGSPKGSLVGEFSVNIADYIMCFTDLTNVIGLMLYRDFEENEDLKMKQEDRSLRRHFSNGDVEESLRTSSIEGKCLRKSFSHMGPNGTRGDSSGSDITLSSSDSSYGVNTPRELGARNSNAGKDHMSNGCQDQQGLQWELAMVPANDSNTDFSISSPRDAFLSVRSQMGLDESVEKLKADLVAMSRRAEVSELELQTLRKQVVKESKRGHDLAREISALKQERDALKDECEQVRPSGKHAGDLKVKSKLQFEGDALILLEEIREELYYEKDMNANLRLQLKKTQESNAELMLAVQDLEEMLEKDSKGVSDLPNRSASGGSESTLEIEESILKSQSDDDEEQKALEAIVRQHSDAHEAYLLEQKIMDLCSEIEMYRRDKDELEMQMEQLALDYEILKQENHDLSSRLKQSHLQEQLKLQYECSGSYSVISDLEAPKKKLQNDLKEQSKELSGCLATIKKLEARNQSLERELEKQAQSFEADKELVIQARMEQEKRAAQAEEALSQADGTINELTTQKEKLNRELKKLLEQFSGSLATIQELETQNHDLEEQLQKKAEGFEADMEALFQAKTEQEQRALQAEEALACSNATITELETHISQLENELKKHSEESSDTMATIKELKAQIQNLEEELEKQAEGFEADLEAVSRARLEQEQRALRAEEALKLMKWKNANAAARIQDEFKRLSSQMQSSFEVNEKLARKAFSEASELRMKNRCLQDRLQKANEELQSAKDDYEIKLQELCSQMNKKATQIDHLVVEIEEKSKQLEDQKKNSDEAQKSVSAEKTMLTAEIERLINKNRSLAEQAKQAEELKSELEKTKTLIKERDNVAGKSLEELGMLKHLKDEEEQVVLNLQSQMDVLRAQCDVLTHSLYENELEKEKVRKQVFQLKADLKKKDQVILNAEKKFKENSGRVLAQERSKATSKNTKCEPVLRGSKEANSKEILTLKEAIKLLEEQIKSKDAALETSANAYLSKEKDLNGKIEELESRLGELSESRLGSGHCELKKEKVSVGMQVDCNVEEVTSSGDLLGGNSKESNEEAFSDNHQQKFDILLKEMVSLKEKNKCMETELKEMQERYSEISLKFAEVEGERQQLVMNLRNLKNPKKV
ncbi:hypothetical protein Cgig2_002403 [Carnegiea gigantea]|uniref:C2 NT-type domain-containing protein n=1 Tax=Carnegiea gigantea TaxID=171969 RepID=A0A9Q1KUX3_9CARY|nr:hypothetical protein Cgig2_002403 [Carnegiea gigantea]